MNPFLFISALACTAASVGGASDDREPVPPFRADLATVDTLELNTQLINQDVSDTEIALAVWMPREYFLAYEISGGAPQRVIDGLTRDLDAVSMFLVAACDITEVQQGQEPLQELVWKAGDQLVEGIELSVDDGTRMKLLRNSEVPATLLAYLGKSLPYITAGFGEVGKHMSFVFFENSRDDGSNSIDPYGDGIVTMVLNGQEMRWRLPIGGLLLPRICGECNDQFTGDYMYCPYDGSALKNVEQTP